MRKRWFYPVAVFSATFLLVGLILATAGSSLAGSNADDFIIENADATNFISYTTPASELVNLLRGAADRFVIQYANAKTAFELVLVPIELSDLIDQVGDRFVIQYANSSAVNAFDYPLDMIGDTLPPEAGDFGSRSTGSSNAKITWTTDEFTTSLFEYGTQTGIYSDSVSDELFRKLHEVELSGLSMGVSYYYRVTSTDRSGNNSISAEQSFQLSQQVFLPVMVR